MGLYIILNMFRVDCDILKAIKGMQITQNIHIQVLNIKNVQPLINANLLDVALLRFKI